MLNNLETHFNSEEFLIFNKRLYLESLFLKQDSSENTIHIVKLSKDLISIDRFVDEIVSWRNNDLNGNFYSNYSQVSRDSTKVYLNNWINDKKIFFIIIKKDSDNKGELLGHVGVIEKDNKICLLDNLRRKPFSFNKEYSSLIYKSLAKIYEYLQIIDFKEIKVEVMSYNSFLVSNYILAGYKIISKKNVDRSSMKILKNGIEISDLKYKNIKVVEMSKKLY